MKTHSEFDDFIKEQAFKLWGDDCLWDSPIEKQFGCALFAISSQSIGPTFVFRGGDNQRVDSIMKYVHGKMGRIPFALIFTQQPVLSYRLDLVMLAKIGRSRKIRRVAVECDGHDFHEKTKEQAARDKKRDREVVGLGLRLLRFTGSEIYKNPFHCASEVVQQIGVAA